jgi:hypothetical protein
MNRGEPLNDVLEVFDLNDEWDLVSVESFDQAGVGESEAGSQNSATSGQSTK